jgi:hypothetical protein
MLNDMAMMRPKLEILPNLHTLEWLFQDIDCMKRVTLFMHQRVRHLVISAPPQSYTAKSSFFLDICDRMPHLHSLDLRVPRNVHLMEENVVELLRGLSDLEEVIFRKLDFTPAIVSELSRMKHVNSVQFKNGSKQGFGEDVMLVLEQGAFPMLQELRITERLEDVTRFMNIDFSPINIASLSIDTYIEYEPEHLHMLLVTLSDRCHLLSELCIRLMHVPARGWATPLPLKPNPAHQIMFNTLRPVLSFRNLTVFGIFHKYPINITLEDIEELASRWPSLKSLSLNEEPLVMSDFTLDLRALLPFARHCPNLHRLGLFMYATATTHPTQELKPFAALRVLCVGTSVVRDPEAVTAFLSHICPPGCELKVGLTWPTVDSRKELDSGMLSKMQSRSDRWRTVHDVLPILIRLRRDEKEKSKALIAALQEEVEDLRTRNHLLTLKSNEGQ